MNIVKWDPFKTMLDWNLPPLRFASVGKPSLYAAWARTSLFASVLATNVDTSADAALDGKLERSAVVEIGGERIGLVGYITEETPSLSSPGDTLGFLPVLDSIRQAVAELESVPGRMQIVREDGSPLVVVDYSHTPDALQKALAKDEGFSFTVDLSSRRAGVRRKRSRAHE